MNNLFNAIPKSVLDKIGDMDLKIESENCLSAVNEVLSKTVLSGGKRLRPMLTYLMGNLFALGPNRLDIFAKAIEMVHGASLAHDDVVDNATQRRGAPSINIEESNKKAVLAGDFLLADVIHSLAHNGDLAIVKEMSRVIQDLAMGEWIQSDAIDNRSYTRELIERIAQYKTASVMSWCTWVGAHVSNAPLEIVEAAKELGRRTGLAFQLMDDTLDFSENSDKDFLLDVKNGVVNSVILEWLELNPVSYKKYKSGVNLEDLFGQQDFGEGIKQALNIVESRAREHMNVASDCLNAISLYQLSKGMTQAQLDERKAPVEFIMSFIIDRSH